MTLKPLDDRMLVQLVETEQVSEGGIYIPETAQKKPQQGVITAIGEGRHVDGKLVPPELQVGDTVLFGTYAGVTVDDNDDNLLLMRENDAFAFIR